jgi:hypothetical protein
MLASIVYMIYSGLGTRNVLIVYIQGVPYLKEQYWNLRFSEMAGDIKVPFGQDVPILMDDT